jgi:hypothetical protein
MDDITNNLPSLQFEAALEEEETSSLPLRYRAHALNVSTCAQATYLVAVLNETREAIQDRKQSKQAKLLQESLSRDPTLIGIIGCGRLGRQLVESFLAFGRCLPQDIFVSTRRPEAIQDLSDRGVSVTFNNSKVAKSVHVLFLCCLPSQLSGVSQDIRGCINYSTLVYSLVGVTPISKLCQLLSFKNILKPEIELLPLTQCSHYPGDFSKDVVESCRDTTVCSMTCPVEPKTKGDCLPLCLPAILTVWSSVNKLKHLTPLQQFSYIGHIRF